MPGLSAGTEEDAGFSLAVQSPQFSNTKIQDNTGTEGRGRGSLGRGIRGSEESLSQEGMLAEIQMTGGDSHTYLGACSISAT